MKVALLRGINVGGKRKILMKDLVSLLEEIGLNNVKTYIQSGNIVFNSPTKYSESELEKLIENSIEKRFSYNVPVIVIDSEKFLQATLNNPFEGENIEKLLITFLSDKANSDNISKLNSIDFSPDLFEITGKLVYLNCTNKYHKSKLTNNLFEKKLNVKATTRNWKTVMAISKIISS